MEFEFFKKFSKLRYGLSEKRDGFMNIRPSGNREYDLAAEKNRERFFKSHNIKGKTFIPCLMHSNEVVVVDERNYQERLKADGFVTNLFNLFLIITVADCLPIYFYDPVRQVIGLAHGGWQGIVKNITKKAISVFKDSFHSNPSDIRLAIGPGIQKCHFVVGEDVIDYFKDYKQLVMAKDNKYNVDLAGIISEQARKEKIRHIESFNECTFCLADKYFSKRRDKSFPVRVMIAYIGIKG